MSQSEGFVAPGQEQKVCRLIKYLYGLKQAPRAWYIKIDKHLLEQGFTRCPFDSNLYLKEHERGAGGFILIIYIDDLVILGSSNMMIAAIKMKRSSLNEYGFLIEVTISDKGKVSERVKAYLKLYKR